MRRIESRLKKLASAFLVVLVLPAIAAAQGGATGAISGSVQDISGAVIAGAEVQIITRTREGSPVD